MLGGPTEVEVYHAPYKECVFFSLSLSLLPWDGAVRDAADLWSASATSDVCRPLNLRPPSPPPQISRVCVADTVAGDQAWKSPSCTHSRRPLTCPHVHSPATRVRV